MEPSQLVVKALARVEAAEAAQSAIRDYAGTHAGAESFARNVQEVDAALKAATVYALVALVKVAGL